jgi:pimeloyl-ACP methyl ester carboxylesterase
MPLAADIYYHFYQGGDEGEKPSVVLIHGAGGTHLYWPSELRRLQGYRVFALDLPGHGKSAGRGQQMIDGYVQCILNWLEGAGVHSAVFVGHSMGAAITLKLALEFSQHVLGLGLIGAGARLRVSPELLDSTASSTTFHNAVTWVIANSFSEQTPDRLTELAERRMLETRPSVLHGDFLACDEFDVTERVASIHQPAVVIYGAEDKMTPPRWSQFLASQLANAELVMVPEAGHMVMLEQPNVVASALSDFLAKIPYP